MKTTHVVGIDPGLVHTGVVQLWFDEGQRRLTVATEAIPGCDPVAVDQALKFVYRGRRDFEPHVFIEKYQPRSHFAGDAKLIAGVAGFRTAFKGSEIILNTGVKKVVRRPLMEVMGCWSFATRTHHQDLRSAARIAIYGMMKQESLNHTLTRLVLDHVDGRSWHVVHA